jgi:hypothetical protein
MMALIDGNECPWIFECPREWQVTGRFGDGFAVQCGGLRAIVDCSVKADGNWWLHLSVSRKSWAPNPEDMRKAKEAFLRDRYAYAVYPPADRYVNIHPFCLHLWARFDGKPVLPEFSEVVHFLGRSI